jgi:S-adenosylmethionine:tRNA ribosyltransferase-isomerase
MQQLTLSDFDFHLPGELLTQNPAPERDGSRLMVVRRGSGELSHHSFREIGNFFTAGDLLVRNNTRVIPARLTARKEHLTKGALIDVLLVREAAAAHPAWVMLLDPLKKLKPGHSLLFGESPPMKGTYTQRLSERECLVEFPEYTDATSLRRDLFAIGATPLPPYMKRKPTTADTVRYQTVYASFEGALAAPTAGLHFTPQLLKNLSDKGVKHAEVTLHVGIGTFYPVHEENLDLIALHSEAYHVSPDAAAAINAVPKASQLLCAVGTTTMRTLETVSNHDGTVTAGTGVSSLFIKPPYRFKTANALITNFHTPRSTLLMMVAAYMGYDLMRQVYDVAIRERYRFFSYGDAMLILP